MGRGSRERTPDKFRIISTPELRQRPRAEIFAYRRRARDCLRKRRRDVWPFALGTREKRKWPRTRTDNTCIDKRRIDGPSVSRGMASARLARDFAPVNTQKLYRGLLLRYSTRGFGAGFAKGVKKVKLEIFTGNAGIMMRGNSRTRDSDFREREREREGGEGRGSRSRNNIGFELVLASRVFRSTRLASCTT